MHTYTYTHIHHTYMQHININKRKACKQGIGNNMANSLQRSAEGGGRVGRRARDSGGCDTKNWNDVL